MLGGNVRGRDGLMMNGLMDGVVVSTMDGWTDGLLRLLPCFLCVESVDKQAQ